MRRLHNLIGYQFGIKASFNILLVSNQRIELANTNININIHKYKCADTI